MRFANFEEEELVLYGDTAKRLQKARLLPPPAHDPMAYSARPSVATFGNGREANP